MPTRGTRGFTRIELLVVLAILLALIGVLLPGLGAARRTARSMQNNTPVRGIHQSLVMHAQGNNGFFVAPESADDAFLIHDGEWRDRAHHPPPQRGAGL